MIKKAFLVPVFALVLAAAGWGALTASADHAWGNYHWARTANPFTLKIADNMSSNWDSYLASTTVDWNLSAVLDTTVVAGKANPRTCKPAAGTVQVCNSKYGNNGWLGIASVWVSGDHITQGTVKTNDTYFNTTTYNTPAWRNLVLCQEIGHTFGLDHQDEDFSNTPLGSCMDYSNDPAQNQHPNAHDYEMLETIYAHLDTTTTVQQTPISRGQDIDHANRAEWGKSIRTTSDGRGALYLRDFGNGQKVFTFVVWANE